MALTRNHRRSNSGLITTTLGGGSPSANRAGRRTLRAIHRELQAAESNRSRNEGGVPLRGGTRRGLETSNRFRFGGSSPPRRQRAVPGVHGLILRNKEAGAGLGFILHLSGPDRDPGLEEPRMVFKKRMAPLG